MIEEVEDMETAVERLIRQLPEKNRNLQMVYAIDNVREVLFQLSQAGEMAEAMFDEVNERLMVASDLIDKMHLTRTYEMKLHHNRMKDEGRELVVSLDAPAEDEQVGYNIEWKDDPNV